MEALIGSAVQSLGIIKTLADGLMTARERNLVIEIKSGLHTQVIKLQGTLISMQEREHMLLDGKRNAEQMAFELQARLEERERYELRELCPGVFAYAYKAGPGATEPLHYLCQPCFDKGVKQVLRHLEDSAGSGAMSWHCAENSAHVIHGG